MDSFIASLHCVVRTLIPVTPVAAQSFRIAPIELSRVFLFSEFRTPAALMAPGRGRSRVIPASAMMRKCA